MAFSLSANLGRMRLSRCSRSTRDDASCCQPCLSAPGSNSSGSVWTGTEHATRVGRNLPRQPIVCVRCWLQTGQVNHSRPPRQPQCCWPLPDASGGSWRKESAQLAQKAESWVRTALRNPNPPRTKGASRHPWLPDRTVQGGPPGWCSNIATNHGEVCGTGIRTMQQESPGRLHVRKCGNPLQQSFMGLGSSGQVGCPTP